MTTGFRSYARLVGACIGCLLAPFGNAFAQEAVGPPAAIAAARAAANDTARGASLRVVLLTADAGEQVWERFGHNLLWIRDERTGESIVWNWGLFDFDEPGFYQRFLLGNTRYWMAGHGAAETLALYRDLGREVVAQELALTPGQRAALDAFVRTNALPDNRYYRYDYFIDNCSTRLRDALDIALGGALHTGLDTRADQPMSYRSEALRLVQHSSALVLGMDVALGARADRLLTEWQSGFIPMRLRDAIRDVAIRGADGVPTPLVATEYVIVPGARPGAPEAIGVARHAVIVIGAAVLLAAVILAAGVAARRAVPAARAVLMTTGVGVHAVFGLVSLVLLFAWFGTRHEFWDWNAHVALMTPVSLIAAVLLPGAMRRGRHQWLGSFHILMVAISASVLVAASFGLPGDRRPLAILLVVWAAAVLVLYASMFAAFFGLKPPIQPAPSPPPEPAGMRMAA